MVRFLISPYVRIFLRILTWAVYLLTIASAFGGYIPPKIWSFPSVLVLALPYMTGLTIACALGWLLARRLVMAGLGVGVILLCSAPMLAASPIGHKRSPEPGRKVYTLLTYNITHGDDMRGKDLSRSSTFDYIMRTDADIVVLQELHEFSTKEIKHFPDSMRDSLFAQYPYRLASDPDVLAILSKYPVRATLRNSPTPRGRSEFVGYSLDVDGHKLDIINCHLTSYLLTDEERQVVTGIRDTETARQSFDELKGSILVKLKESFRKRADDATELRGVLDSIGAGTPVIVCGDFNDVPASWTYRTVMGPDLRDAYRETCFGPTYTFNRHLFLFHIDQILYRGPLDFLSVSRGRINSSDHYPLLATFQFDN